MPNARKRYPYASARSKGARSGKKELAMSASNLATRVFRLSIVRLAVVLSLLLLTVVVRDVVMAILGGMLGERDSAPALWFGRPRSPSMMTIAGATYGVLGFLVTVGAGFWVYRRYVRRIEKREPTELDAAGALREIAVGTSIGASIIFAVLLVLLLAGDVAITPSEAWLFAVPAAAMAATAACMEELVLRGIVLRFLERGLGTAAALGLTALFGVLHRTNPNATWVSSLTIAASGGLLLGLAYVLTRRLWLAIGLHFGVNVKGRCPECRCRAWTPGGCS